MWMTKMTYFSEQFQELQGKQQSFASEIIKLTYAVLMAIAEFKIS